jgi:hypothetical protein
VDCEPLLDLLPDHPPEAAHAVARVEVQLSVEFAPLFTTLGLALKATVGGASVTETVADCEALPPAPLQVSAYVSLALSSPVDCEPLLGLVPDQAPEAVHSVAFADDQVSMELAPLLSVLGSALNFTLAPKGEPTVTVAVCTAGPPMPLQVSV